MELVLVKNSQTSKSLKRSKVINCNTIYFVVLINLMGILFKTKYLEPAVVSRTYAGYFKNTFREVVIFRVT